MLQKYCRKGHIQVTMYNFGSPRVGTKRFADMYNQVSMLAIVFGT
jgi:predicted lipase